MKKFPLFLLLITTLVGCLGEEDFSSSNKDVLSFSVDTLALDTVISGAGTNTYDLWAFNRSKKAIRLTNIMLGQGSASPFRVNVDGEFLPGGQMVNGSQIEVLSKDSLRIFVELTAPITGKDEVQPLEDRLIFTTEAGGRSEVILTAYGQDVIEMKAVTIKSDTTLNAKKPYQILDSLVVSEGATLRLAAGTRLLFHPDANLIVRGKLIADGTLENPVVLRGDRLGKMFSNQKYDEVFNQWDGVVFEPTSKGNVLTYCDIHSANYGIKAYNTSLHIENSVIHNFRGHGIESQESEIYAGNCQITNAGGDCLNLKGGSYMFVHCTIARFQNILGSLGGVALRFTNFIDETPAPLNQLDFYNCIITGYEEDEMMGDDISTEENLTPFSYGFYNSLLCTPETEDLNQTNCIREGKVGKDDWKHEDIELDDTVTVLKRWQHFNPLSKFVLHPHSRAVGTADTNVTLKTFPNDRLGRARLEDGAADMGCYEHAAPKSEQ